MIKIHVIEENESNRMASCQITCSEFSNPCYSYNFREGCPFPRPFGRRPFAYRHEMFIWSFPNLTFTSLFRSILGSTL